MRLKLKLWKKDSLMVSTDSGKRGTISHHIGTTNFTKGYIRVGYGNKHFNDETFKTLSDAKWYITTFTEKDLALTLQSL